ncbi:MAG: UDP-2,3-diacylglucosamine diphosphatase LpxI [Thermodesulfobacteriota bacterium]
MTRIGLVAGSSQFPILLAQAARKNGLSVSAVALEGETDPALADLVDSLLWVKIGQLQKAIDFFKEGRITEAVMAGGLNKKNMFRGFDPDARALAVAARLPHLNDDALLRAMAEEFAQDGIKIKPTTEFTPELAAPEGVLTRRSPTAEETADIEFGWRIAKALGAMDVGQCVVVRRRTVLALEAIEGSDETIRRGGRLAREKAVVVKVCKPNQDLRFDLPCVGLGTLAAMSEVKASVLALEAGRTLMFDREEMIAAADREGMAVIARQGEEPCSG